MAKTKRFDDEAISKLPVGDHADPQRPGAFIRVQATGRRGYKTQARDPKGDQKWLTVQLRAADGRLLKSIDDARLEADATKRMVRAGSYVGKGSRFDTSPDGFESVANKWIESLEAREVITVDLMESSLSRAKEAWRGRSFTSIKRSDIVALLDKVASEHGPTAADYLVARLHSLTKWFASRNDDYSSPLFGVNLRRTSNNERARERILSDAEIRAVWRAAESDGIFGAFVRICLLTGQRRTKVSEMKWAHLDRDTWHMPREKREKGVGGTLRLSPATREIINAQPRFVSSPFVFTSRTGGPFRGWSVAKVKLDAKCGVTDWRLHDLRRTARSLLSRAGVPPHIAERVLGHAIRGVEGIYDRHGYEDDKADALVKLAELIEKIVRTETESAKAA